MSRILGYSDLQVSRHDSFVQDTGVLCGINLICSCAQLGLLAPEKKDEQ